MTGRGFQKQLGCLRQRQREQNKEQQAVNEEHRLVAFGWNDVKPLQFLVLVDKNANTAVQRQVCNNKQTIATPFGLKKYNKFMGGVDLFDQLLSLFERNLEKVICDTQQFAMSQDSSRKGPTFLPMSMTSALLDGRLSYKGANCQVCAFEDRKRKTRMIIFVK